MLRLLTFGGVALVRRDGSPPPRPRPQRLAILAVLASAGSRGISRERVSALFWPDADPERARHSLRQALYALRKELGAEVTRPEAILSIDRDVLTSDVGDFRDAMLAQDPDRAGALATGPFLQGFQLSTAPEFDRWVDETRMSLSVDASRAMLQLAKAADAAQDADAAAEWWRRLTLLDPLSGRFAAGYLKVLAARGERAAALAFARAHEDLVRRELDADPDPGIRTLEAQLRARPVPHVVRIVSSPSAGHTAPDAQVASPSLDASVSVIAPADGGTMATRRRRTRMLVGAVAALFVVSVGGWRVKDVTAALGLTSLPMATLAVGPVSEATTESPVAYRLYDEGLRAYHQYDVAAARRLMEAALEEDSTFAMAAYYHALTLFGHGNGTAAGLRALRLAGRAPERQRLLIAADISIALNDPASLSVAETLATKYRTDPRAASLLSLALASRGDWPRAVAAGERAIALDSAAEPVERPDCRLCDDVAHVAGIYLLWDSLPAAERTARRLLRLRPQHHVSWDVLLRAAAAKGDSSALRTYYRRFHAVHPQSTPPLYLPRYLILAGQYDQAGLELQPWLGSSRKAEADDARWLRAIALRNQGRYAEAAELTRLRGGDRDVLAALLALERNEVQAAVSRFEAIVRADETQWAPGVQARAHAWKRTLLGMALLTAGDTGRVRELVDSVAYWGARSNYGRDRRLHHYLRGMLLVAQRRDAEAAVELRDAISSPSHGFTRVNHELGRVLMRLDRPADAVQVVRAALHGDIDGSNLYITRTELHELLAQAFDRLGMRDSARVHHRAVADAWRHADALLHARRDTAVSRLAGTRVARAR